MIEPYLFFNGNSEEALEFYGRVLGARLEMLMRFSESPEPIPAERLPAGSENKVMHGSMLIGDQRIMVSDGGCMTGKTFAGFCLSLTVPTEEEARQKFDGLADGGRVDMPLGPTFWSPFFGMVTDKFGIQWMVTLPDPQK
jgi:PhnB protein